MANRFYNPPSKSTVGQSMMGVGQILGAARREREKKEKAEKVQQGFMEAFQSKDPNIVADFVSKNPESQDILQETFNYKDSKTKKNQVDTLRLILSNPDGAMEYMQNRVNYLDSVGADPSTALQGIELLKDDKEKFLENAELGYAAVSSANEWDAYNKSNKTDEVKVSEVQSSKMMPGGGVQIVRKDGAVEYIPASEASEDLILNAEERGAELQGLRSRERESGKASVKKANRLIEVSSNLRANNRNLRKAILFLDEDANTGPVYRLLPSLTAASVKLQNLQAQLGLDVVGAVTFGALSKGELDLAKSVALPTGLPPLELKKWVEAKILAQEKLMTYLEDQAIFLDSGGTSAGWIQNIRDEKELRVQKEQNIDNVSNEKSINDLVNKYAN